MSVARLISKRWQGNEQAGLLSHEIYLWDADAVGKVEGNTDGSVSLATGGPHGVEEPLHAWKHTGRESGYPAIDLTLAGKVRAVNPKEQDSDV
jgi:hypothetical protein